jgi:hypothetical protein
MSTTNGTHRPAAPARTAGYRNGYPALRPYVYRGAEADMEEAIRERLAAVRAQFAAEPDPNAVSYEWRREQLAEIAEPPQVPAPVAPPAPEPKPRCDRCGYLTIRCDCPGGPK